MVTLDKVEKLRAKANISYDEAKVALEKTNGDILEAVINLEKENKIPSPTGGGRYSSEETPVDDTGASYNGNDGTRKNHFGKILHKIFKGFGRLLEWGNRNSFKVKREEENVVTLPVTVLVGLLLFTFWITLPILVVALFFGYRYMFSGPDLGKEKVNRALERVAKMAENIKKGFKD